MPPHERAQGINEGSTDAGMHTLQHRHVSSIHVNVHKRIRGLVSVRMPVGVFMTICEHVLCIDVCLDAAVQCPFVVVVLVDTRLQVVRYARPQLQVPDGWSNLPYTVCCARASRACAVRVRVRVCMSPPMDLFASAALLLLALHTPKHARTHARSLHMHTSVHVCAAHMCKHASTSTHPHTCACMSK